MEGQLGSFYFSKVLPAAEFIKTCKECYGNVVLSFNGGKDCTVVLEIAERFNIDIPVIVFEELDSFSELKKFTEDRLRTSKLSHIFASHDIKKEMKHLTNKGVKGVVLGQRSTDPARPSALIERSSPEWGDYLRIYPILNWTYSDIWFFLENTNSQYCDLYKNGYTSIGGKSNTLPNPDLQGRHAKYLFNPFHERLGREKL